MRGGECDPKGSEGTSPGPRALGMVLAGAVAVVLGASAWELFDLAIGLTVGLVVSLISFSALGLYGARARLRDVLKPALLGPRNQRDEESGEYQELWDRKRMSAWLQKERAGQHELRASLRLWRVLWLIGAFVVVLSLWWIDRVLQVGLTGVDLGFAGFLVFIFLFGFLLTRARLQEMNADFQATDYEILVLNLKEGHERTAASLFFKHQFELKRYYDQNLRQNGQVFALGALCVLAGLGIVAGAAAWIVINSDSALAVQVAVGMLGAVGGILAGGIATIFIRMYVGTGTALREFHRRLVATNRLHFANLLTATVASPRKRTKLTAELVKAACKDGEGERPAQRDPWLQ